MRRIIITEEQEKIILSCILDEEKNFFVDTDKVLIIKKFLESNFKRASMQQTDKMGNPSTISLVGMLGPDGSVVRNLTDRQLFDYLQDRYKNIYTNNIQRDKFLAQVIKDWFYNKIDDNGMLSVNKY